MTFAIEFFGEYYVGTGCDWLADWAPRSVLGDVLDRRAGGARVPGDVGASAAVQGGSGGGLVSEVLTGCPQHDTPRMTGIAIIDDARKRESPRFFGIPDRWYDVLHFRCVNGHVSTGVLRSEMRGDLCLACMSSVYMTFPEDVSDGQ